MTLALPSWDWWSVWSRAAEIAATRNGGAQAIAAAAARRTGALIAFAATHSVFYREHWPQLPPDGTRLDRLPVVTRRELMARFDDWVTDPAVAHAVVEAHLHDRTKIGEPIEGKYLAWKSSGTTGVPGMYVQDASAITVYDAMLALELRSLDVAGHYAWGLLAQGGRAALVAATGDHFASVASWRRVCRTVPWRQARAFSVAQPLRGLVEDLNAFQPAFLASYPSTLAMLAEEQRSGRLRIAPSCLWSGGEYLSRTGHAAIERAFHTLLVNEYGASECLSMAHSCRLGTLHVNADWVVLEPVDRNYRPTPAGEPSHTVLLTNLANRVQPLVRYDLGDSVTVLPPCPCGSPLPAIEAHGRSDDVLRLRADDGTEVPVSPLALATAMEDAIAGRRFQVVQTGPADIDVRLDAAEPSQRAAQWHAVRRALRAFLVSQSVGDVRVRLANEAPAPERGSGKLREVVAAPFARPHEGGHHVHEP
jgi:phenylacetate-coenzyme A ligase PaaK-like adenylate-forming protein